MPILPECEILLGGGTNMWSNPPNYLLFRYPPWPPKWGFLAPPGNGGFLGGYRKLDFCTCAKSVFSAHSGKHVFCAHPETGDFGVSPKSCILTCQERTPSGMGSCQGSPCVSWNSRDVAGILTRATDGASVKFRSKASTHEVCTRSS
jgi:hypothetical protein